MYESTKLAKLLKQQEMKENCLDIKTFIDGFESFLQKMDMPEEKKQLIVYREDLIHYKIRINS